MHLLSESGPATPYHRFFTLPGSSRVSVPLSALPGPLPTSPPPSGRCGVEVLEDGTSTGGLVVEGAMYWNAPGQLFAAGANWPGNPGAVNQPAAPAISRRPSRWREPGLWLPVLALACGVALLAPLAQPLVTKRIFVYNDLTWFHLPMRHLYQQALIAGDSVLWTPSIFSGFYFHGEGQTGACSILSTC